jgi:hypothetical protein
MHINFQQIEFSNPTLSQINFASTVDIKINTVGNDTMLFEDKIDNVFGFNFDAKNNSLYFQIQQWQLMNLKSKPLSNVIGMSDVEYSSIIDYFSFMLTFLKRYFNRISFS